MKVVGTAKSASGLCIPTLLLNYWNVAHNTSRNDFATAKIRLLAMVHQSIDPAQDSAEDSILFHSNIIASVAFALCRLRLWMTGSGQSRRDAAESFLGELATSLERESEGKLGRGSKRG